MTGFSLVLAAAMFQLLPPATAAPDDNGLFELDANILDSASAGDDWSNIFDSPDTDSAFLDTGIVVDIPAASNGNMDAIFTGGGSKDDLDITQWQYSPDGNVPAKDNITNAYAAAYADAGDTFVYFGLDRYTRLGSSFVGAWLLQDKTFGMDADGTFSGQHVAFDDKGTADPSDDQRGDVLILSEFSEGGTAIHLKIFEWVSSGGDEAANLRTIFGSGVSSADCDDTGNAVPACANVNTTKLTNADIPWPYAGKALPKDNKAGLPAVGTDEMAPGVFFEGGINLDALFGDAPCFSDIVLETRSSFSTDAVLKDLVTRDFELCDADVSIAADAVNQVGQAHTWTVTATREVAGASSPAPLDAGDLTVTLTDAQGNPVTPTANQCADGPEAEIDDGTCTITFNSTTPGTITGHVEGVVSIGGEDIAVSTGGEGENPDATKVFVDARISIAEDGLNGIGEPHTFTVLAEADKGDGNGFQPVTAGNVDVTLDPGLNGTANPVVDNTASTCDDNQPTGDNLDANGKCTVVFSSSTPGKVTGTATFTATLATSEGNIVVTRSTDGLSDFGSANSDGAEKTFVEGTITWIKHDDLGALLPGATFWVCQTQSWNSDLNAGAGGYVGIPDTDNDLPADKSNDSRCFVVADDVLADDPDATTPDADDTGGLFKLEHLTLGTYTVQEKDPPTGYAIDPDEETLQINTTTTSAKPTQVVEGQTVDKPFVDPALFKVIVLTCNTSTEQLVVSEVDEAPGTAGGVKDTQAAGALTPEQQAMICGLEANYDNKARGEHTYKVTIPDPTP